MIRIQSLLKDVIDLFCLDVRWSRLVYDWLFESQDYMNPWCANMLSSVLLLVLSVLSTVSNYA